MAERMKDRRTCRVNRGVSLGSYLHTDRQTDRHHPRHLCLNTHICVKGVEKVSVSVGVFVFL